LAIGDLHGNAMKGIYFLIRYGVLTLEKSDDYTELLAIYNKQTNKLTRQDLMRFGEILDRATIKKPKLITFIGDELADRGNNDWFTLLLMKKLHDSGVPYHIQLSNHSSVALQSFITQSPLPGIIGTTEKNQQQSLDNMWSLVSQKVISGEEIIDLANQVYKPQLRMIGYTKTTDNQITLYTHAPVGLETIQALATKLGVTYNDSTVNDLIKCIDEINEKSLTKITNSTFKQLHDVTRQMSCLDPFYRLFWARKLEKTFTLKPYKGSFNIQLVHGHVGPEENLNKELVNLDSHWGMFSEQDDKGDCTVFCDGSREDLKKLLLVEDDKGDCTVFCDGSREDLKKLLLVENAREFLMLTTGLLKEDESSPIQSFIENPRSYDVNKFKKQISDLHTKLIARAASYTVMNAFYQLCKAMGIEKSACFRGFFQLQKAHEIIQEIANPDSDTSTRHIS
jgi:hypothetical protein